MGYGTAYVAPDTIYAQAFLVPQKATFNRIAIEVMNASWLDPDLAHLGIYNDDGNAYPATLVLDAGTVSTQSAGLKEITINQQLDPGLYWLAFLQGGAATLYVFSSFINILGSPNGPIQLSSVWEVPYAYGALPATFPSAAYPSTAVPSMSISLRCASVP
jgi:hypothetical protein